MLFLRASPAVESCSSVLGSERYAGQQLCGSAALLLCGTAALRQAGHRSTPFAAALRSAGSAVIPRGREEQHVEEHGELGPRHGGRDTCICIDG